MFTPNHMKDHRFPQTRKSRYAFSIPSFLLGRIRHARWTEAQGMVKAAGREWAFVCWQ